MLQIDAEGDDHIFLIVAWEVVMAMVAVTDVVLAQFWPWTAEFALFGFSDNLKVSEYHLPLSNIECGVRSKTQLQLQKYILKLH